MGCRQASSARLTRVMASQQKKGLANVGEVLDAKFKVCRSS